MHLKKCKIAAILSRGISYKIIKLINFQKQDATLVRENDFNNLFQNKQIRDTPSNQWWCSITHIYKLGQGKFMCLHTGVDDESANGQMICDRSSNYFFNKSTCCFGWQCEYISIHNRQNMFIYFYVHITLWLPEVLEKLLSKLSAWVCKSVTYLTLGHPDKTTCVVWYILCWNLWLIGPCGMWW